MNPEQFARLREILYTLPTLAEDQRAAYVESMCGDDAELRAEAQSFLDTDFGSPRILQTGALTSIARSALGGRSPESTAMPSSIGPYRIVGVLGQGGMGVVYRAEQTEPLRREVAIKVMGGHHSSRQIFGRFEAERQTLAVMEHSNIARLFDADATPGGQPYFVMELVRGVPVHEYSRQQDLSVAERVELLRQACAGVQHAHQKGIIHRDLKPSNLLVTEVEGRAVVKIIDFGIARALEAEAVGPVELTQEGQILGTPEYMSPEQATGETSLVDVRSDVYSLGVVLYELLADVLPYDVASESVLERARIIREVIPPPLRAPDGAPPLDPELDTITRKSLEKSPEDRYASVGALDEDLRRHLESEPILAHPPSALYQLRKLVRRHRLAFGLAAAAGVLLVGFSVTMTWMFQEQRRQSQRAERESLKAERVSAFLQGMLSSPDPYQEGKDVKVLDVLDQAARDLDQSLDEEPSLELEMRRTLGDTYLGLGEREAAAEHLERAMSLLAEVEDLDPRVEARVRMDYARYLRDQSPGEGEAMAIEAMGLDPRPELEVEGLVLLSAIARLQGSLARAESLAHEGAVLARRTYGARHLETIEAQEALADVMYKQGRGEESIAIYRETSGLLEKELGPDHPRYVRSMNSLATALQRGTQEEREESEALLREVLERSRELLGPDHGAVAVAHNNLAVNFMERGVRLTEGEAHMAEAVRIWSATLPAGHSNQIIGHNNLAYLKLLQLKYEGAEESYRAALALRSVADPDSPDFLYPLDNLGWTCLAQGKGDEAVAPLREADRIRQKVLREEDNWYFFHSAAIILTAALVEVGDYDEARAVGEPRLQHVLDDPVGMLQAVLRNSLGRAYAASGEHAIADSLVKSSIPYLLDGYHSEWERIAERLYLLRCTIEQMELRGQLEEAERLRRRASELEARALASRTGAP